jgi:xylan 1,4-beta-xylosidase
MIRLSVILSILTFPALMSYSETLPEFKLLDQSTTSSARGACFENPVVRGFSPDPSICRVGDDFYMVCSSFEYFPGVPVYHSRDLVNWELISYCLTTPEQLPLNDCPSSSGIYAATLRYHDGLFYMITTNFADKGEFYVTAKNPRGPWSNPVWLGAMNADPSLLFDDDGRTYVVHPGSFGPRGGLIYLMELDLDKGAYKEGQQLPGSLVWTGTGGQFPEGPHLFKINGRYYLMVAEGGTGSDHRETIASSDNPFGPYIPFENNPILTHRDLPDNPISSAGHADMVQLQDGSWWGVCLGVRQKNGVSPLGRESFLVPVEWNDEGWPIMGERRRVTLQGPGPAIARHPFPAKPVRDDFTSASLDLEWNYVRNPDLSLYSLSARPGWLRLVGSAATLDDAASPTALLRRQKNINLSFATRMDFQPSRDGEEAGIVLRQTDSLHADFCVRRTNGERRLVLSLTDPRKKVEMFNILAPEGAIRLCVVADRDKYRFMWKAEDGSSGEAGSIPSVVLTVESSWSNGGVMCFTGMMIGVYASGNGAASVTPADFDWFDYEVTNHSHKCS